MAPKYAQEGFPIKTSNVEPHDIIYEVDDMKLKENMRSCQHFLVDSEVESVRYKIIICAVESIIGTIKGELFIAFFQQ